MLNYLRQFLKPSKKRANLIVLGIDYPEYKVFKSLISEGDKVAFFISDDPWKYNTLIEGVVCRSPNELNILCSKYSIDCVYYCDKAWLQKIPKVPTKTLLVKYLI
jgi:hypothetical protein